MKRAEFFLRSVLIALAVGVSGPAVLRRKFRPPNPGRPSRWRRSSRTRRMIGVRSRRSRAFAWW
jgi:hypothetical protein